MTMKKTAFLLVIACITASCVESFYAPSVFLLNAQPFKAHNNYVEAFYNGDRFIQPQDYVKVAVIRQKTDSPNIDRQISVLKKVAQSNGADGILILGINDPGITIAKKYHLGQDVIKILAKEEANDYYTRSKENSITVLAVKYKSNLKNIDKKLKKVELYAYNPHQHSYEFEDSLLFSVDSQMISPSHKTQYTRILLNYSNDFTGTAASPKVEATTKVEYNKNGVIIFQEKTFPKKKNKEVITYNYNNEKLVGRVIKTGDNKELIEEYKIDSQNKINEVYIYKQSKNQRVPLMMLKCVYYTLDDFSQNNNNL